MTVPIKGGAPAKYTSPEEMEEVIDQYFESCWEEVWNRTYNKKDDITTWVQEFDREGKPVIRLKERPTVTGLALALGFSTRLTLMNYQVKPEYMNAIKKAKMLIEHYYEKGVAEGAIHPATGIFILKNFEWKDTFDINTNAPPERLNAIDITEKIKEIKATN